MHHPLPQTAVPTSRRLQPLLRAIGVVAIAGVAAACTPALLQKTPVHDVAQNPGICATKTDYFAFTACITARTGSAFHAPDNPYLVLAERRENEIRRAVAGGEMTGAEGIAAYKSALYKLGALEHAEFTGWLHRNTAVAALMAEDPSMRPETGGPRSVICEQVGDRYRLQARHWLPEGAPVKTGPARHSDNAGCDDWGAPRNGAQANPDMRDYDRDGLPNVLDADSDGDGTPDTEDPSVYGDSNYTHTPRWQHAPGR